MHKKQDLEGMKCIHFMCMEDVTLRNYLSRAIEQAIGGHFINCVVKGLYVEEHCENPSYLNAYK